MKTTAFLATALAATLGLSSLAQAQPSRHEARQDAREAREDIRERAP